MARTTVAAATGLINPTGLVVLSALIVVLFAGLLNWTSIGLDNDPYYHLNAGRYIIGEHQLPTESLFSYLEPPRS